MDGATTHDRGRKMTKISAHLARASGAFAALTLLSGLALGQQLRPQSLPAFEDYVISLEAPGAEGLEYYDTSTGDDYFNGSFAPTKSARSQIYFDDLSPIQLELIIFEDEISLENWVDSRDDLAEEIFKIDPEDISRKKIFDGGYNQTMGQTTHYRYVSPTSVFENGDYVKRNFRNPVGKEYAAVFDGRAVVSLRFMDDGGSEINPAQEAALDRIAASVGVRYEELFDSFRETEYFSTRSGNPLSV